MSLIKELVAMIEERQGQDVVLLDMQTASPLMDYMIVTHVSNPRLLMALANYVKDFLDQKQINYSPIEGSQSSRWLLIDGKDVVIHIFLEDERENYNLEKLWVDCIVDANSLS